MTTEAKKEVTQVIDKDGNKVPLNFTDVLKEVLTKDGAISSCYSNFHNYSINNQFLAYYQLKLKGLKVTPINSMGGWNKLNRRVKKGEKAIYLWMPMGGYTREVVNEETGEKEVIKYGTKFRFVPKWFSLEQTHGEEITPDKISLPKFDFKKAYKELEIKLIDFEMIDGNCQGYAIPDKRELAINPIAEHPEKTILHELAHIVLKHHEEKFSRSVKELEAEATAYIIGSVLKCFTENDLKESRGYIQGWYKEKDIPEENAKRIMSTAQKILKAGSVA